MVKIYFNSILLLGISAALILGLIVYLKGKKNTINTTWFITCMSASLWSLFYFLTINASDKASALIFIKFTNIIGLLVPLSWLFFVTFFLEKQKKLVSKFMLLIFSISSLIIFWSALSSGFIKDLVPKYVFNYYIEPDSGYFSYMIYFTLIVLYGLYLLLKEYKNTSLEKRGQLKLMIFASSLGFLGGGSVFVLTFNPNFPPYSLVLFTIFPLMIGYAIFKYQLFNVKVILTELLTFMIWIFVLVRMLLADNLQDRLINGGLLLFLVISGILLIRSVLKEVRAREEIERLAGELEKANIRLTELDQAKSEFVTITSHQLRAPVTAIKGYASMLMEGSFGPVPKKAKIAVDRIFQSSDRLVRLIADFLNLSRIERGKMEYDFQKFDLKEIIKNIFDDFTQINNKRKSPLKFTLELDNNEEFIVNVDQEKIRQAISNIVDNALKYTKEGYVKLFLYKDNEKEKIIFKTNDSGMGMNKNALARIFQKFTRAQNGSLSVHVDGTGLGLYVAKEIMEAHGGNIWAESDGFGKGSSFFIEFPMVK